MNNNYKVLFGLKTLKSIIGLFIDTFFVLYFLTLSNDNIFPLSIYYIIVYCALFTTSFLLRNICKSRKRIHLFRIGILLNFLYFLYIYIVKDGMINNILLIGVLYGMEESAYYSVYNNIESVGVYNRNRQSFLGVFTTVSSLIRVFLPLLFGSIMNNNGFEQCIVLVLVLIILQLILSAFFVDRVPDERKRTNIKGFINSLKENKIVKKVYKTSFLTGLTYYGAFNSIITIYIIRTVDNSISYGIFNSIFGIITSLIGLYFAKWVKPDHYKNQLKLASIFTIIGLLCIIIKCNFFTVILFNLLQTYSKTIVPSINERYIFNISNLNEIKTKYKVEYLLCYEGVLFIGRVISYLMLMLMAIWSTTTGTNVILGIFGILIIIYNINIAKLQDEYNSK